jgi:hypothetical protein
MIAVSRQRRGVRDGRAAPGVGAARHRGNDQKRSARLSVHRRNTCVFQALLGASKDVVFFYTDFKMGCFSAPIFNGLAGKPKRRLVDVEIALHATHCVTCRNFIECCIV